MGAKALGGVLLLAAALLWGILRIAALRRSLSLAAGYLALLRHIRAQIEGLAMPIGAIFATADTRLLAACGKPHARDLGELLEASGAQLAPAVRAQLSEFASTLGTTQRAEQLRVCDGAIARLEPLLAAARADAPRRERLLLLLPPLGVGLIFLLLL